MAFTPRRFKEFQTRLLNRMVARTNLTDVEVGAQLWMAMTALARQLDAISYQMIVLRRIFDISKARGRDLDDRMAEYDPEDVPPRYTALKAQGSVVFGRSGTTGTVSIPIGSLVRVSSTGPEFETTAAGQITAGNTTSASVTIRAVDGSAGAQGNVAAGTITQMNAIPGVQTVTNPAATSGGVDRESDEAYQARGRAFRRSRVKGTAQALASAAQVQLADYGRITTAEPETWPSLPTGQVNIYVDDGAGTVSRTADNYSAPETLVASASGGERRFRATSRPLVAGESVILKINGVTQTEDTHYTVNYATGEIALDDTAYPTGLTTADTLTVAYTYYYGLIAEAQKVIDGDPDDPTNYPGVVAYGILASVLPATAIYQVFRLQVVYATAADKESVDAEVKGEILAYVNALPINGDVLLSELIARVKRISGVHDVVFEVPAKTVVMGPREVARTRLENIIIT